MNCITKEVQTQIEIKRSKFIAFALPYEEFEAKLHSLKNKHFKASHIVWAYRYFNEYNQIIEAQSDDGEPKGAAGMPVLKVLQGNELINSAIIVVRYFGGIKLGVGGMARAYASATKAVLDCAFIETFIKKEKFIFSLPYAMQRKMEFLLKKLNIEPKREFLADEIKYEVFADFKKIKRIKELLL